MRSVSYLCCQQVGDVIWSMLPGARTLSHTPITGKHTVVEPGYVNIRTVTGKLPS